MMCGGVLRRRPELVPMRRVRRRRGLSWGVRLALVILGAALGFMAGVLYAGACIMWGL